MRNLVKVFLIASMILIIFVGCSTNQNAEESHVSVDELMSMIKEQIIEDLIEDGADEEDIIIDGNLAGYIDADLKDDEEAEFYVESMQLDGEKLEEGRALASMMNINSNAIFVLKAKEQEDVPSLKEALERELENQIRTWEQYLPDQHEKVKNNIITTKGKYLLYVTYEYPERIEEVFEKHL